MAVRRQITMLALTTLLVVASFGCIGELSNAPYLEGEARITGQIQGGVDPASAWVAVLGEEDLIAQVDVEGRFVIDRVPIGWTELAASTGLGAAARQELLVLGESENQVALVPGPAATVSGLVTLAGEELARRSTVAVEGLPVETKTAADGRFRLPGLPPGCFQVWAEHVEHRRSQVQACLAAGAEQVVDLHLLETSDDGPGSDGGSGASAAPLCAPCTEDADCADGWCFLHVEEGATERVCTVSCAEDTDCPQGFHCEEDDTRPGARVCLPHESSCTARANFGAPCTEQELCGLGEGDGACLDDRCTVECDGDQDCPGDATCISVPDQSHGLCA